MGTKIHCKSYFPGFYSMRDLNDDSSSSSWPLFYGDKTVANGQCHNGFLPSNGYPGHDKDTLKQKMLEHEAVFKNQVCELHRLYRIQRDMMEEVKRKHRASIEPASSSSLQGSQALLEDARKWHMAGFPLLSSSYGRTSVAGVENFSSPMSCTKKQQGHFFQNGSNFKDSEALDSRPLKVRKKLFDLQLPADEYVDPEEENLRQHKESDISSYTPNGNIKSGPESSMEVFLGVNVVTKTDNRMNASATAPCLRGSIGLADLNEPIQIEEAKGPSSIDFLGRTSDNVAIHQPAKSTAGYLGVTGETMHVRDGFLISSSNESLVNERGRLSHITKAGSSRPNPSSIMSGCEYKSPLPCHPGQCMISQVHLPPGTYPSSYNREAPWRGFRHGLESSRSYDHSNNSHLEPIASQTPSSYPFFSSSSFGSSWAHSVSTWQKPSSSFTQKVTEEPFSVKWHANYNFCSNPCSGSESKPNGFYHSSASGLKELQVQCLPAGFDHLNNCSRGDTVAYERSTNHGLGNLPRGSCYADSKPAIDINLNEDLNTTDGKSNPEENFSMLPWLKPKPVHVNEVADSRRSELPRESSYLHASSNGLCCKNETVRDVNKLFPSKVVSTSCDSKKEIAQTHTVKKILGVPIFERNVQENEPSMSERKNGVIDINVACEPDEQIAAEELSVENEKQKKGRIDLNSCVDDCEDPPGQKSASVKIALEIDLEVPAFSESEDDTTPFKEKMPDEQDEQSLEKKNEQIQDEALRNAAETILAISSWTQIITEDSIHLPSEASLEEALVWFVEAVSNEIVNTSAKESGEMDDFEATTLQLSETKEEDYMPTPSVLEVEKVEETSVTALSTRSRRGHARRGRQRRDFQRDILPGLASLSRHEVTEDLQIFGGLMRATGHHWTSGLTRRNGTRNGGGRGRRRAVIETVAPVITSPVSTPLVQQLNSIDAGLEDRSLTGWGKTTRRPRRQRCPAGTPPTVALM